jgi:hypothetical protein
MKDEKLRIQSEPQLETLVQSSFRWELEHEATKRVEPITFRQVFSEVKRDEEIASIVKLITPIQQRTTLLSGTVSS